MDAIKKVIDIYIEKLQKGGWVQLDLPNMQLSISEQWKRHDEAII